MSSAAPCASGCNISAQFIRLSARTGSELPTPDSAPRNISTTGACLSANDSEVAESERVYASQEDVCIVYTCAVSILFT